MTIAGESEEMQRYRPVLHHVASEWPELMFHAQQIKGSNSA
jgi:hypothetical protein